MPPYQHLKSSTSPLRIVLIGSGVSNAQAAISLKNSGLISSPAMQKTSIKILEADNVPFGRMRQSKYIHPETEIDIGGEIIHGESPELKNLMERLIKEQQQQQQQSSSSTPPHLIKLFDLNDSSYLSFFNSQQLQSSRQNRHKMRQLIDLLEERLEALLEGVDVKSGIKASSGERVVFQHESMYDTFSKLLEQCIQEDDSILQYTSRQQVMDILDSRFAKTFGSLDLKSMGTLAVLGEELAARDDESENWVCSTGYGILRDYFQREMGHLIQYNSQVTMVQQRLHDKENPVVVHYVDKCTNQTHQELCDVVIVGVPLSILKRRKLTFSPALPASKQEAIQHLQMSYGAKVFITFNNQKEMLQRWREQFDKATIVFPGDDDYIAQVWISAVPETHHQMVITGFTTGDRAGNLCTLSNSQIELNFKRLLGKMLGEDIVQRNYDKCFIQNWSMEPYILGGYSCEGVDSVGAREELSTPVNGRIFFSGEHCCVSAPATIHGAIRSGIEAAQKVVELHGKQADSTLRSKL